MRPTEDQQRAIVAQREREAIAVELAGLRRDAERYRWLREKATIWSDIFDGHYRVSLSPLTVSAIKKGKDPACNVLDAAIDLAIKEASHD